MADVVEAFQVNLSGDRAVLFVPLKSGDLQRMSANAGLERDDHPLVVGNKMAITGLQLSIIEVAGEKIGFEDLRKRWSELFSFKDQQRLITAFNIVNYEGDEGNVKPVPVTIST